MCRGQLFKKDRQALVQGISGHLRIVIGLEVPIGAGQGKPGGRFPGGRKLDAVVMPGDAIGEDQIHTRGRRPWSEGVEIVIDGVEQGDVQGEALVGLPAIACLVGQGGIRGEVF